MLSLARDMTNHADACGVRVDDICVEARLEENRSPLVSLLLLFVGVRFQVCFTPLAGVLFTFPSRY